MRGSAIDLILLDIVLPEMGGEEFFRELRLVRRAATSVIVCSVDEKLIEPLRRIGPVQGTFLKGDPGSVARRDDQGAARPVARRGAAAVDGR